MKLNLEEVKESGRSHFATLDSTHHPYTIGRDLTCDLPVANNALSRQHGTFFGFQSGWAYRDLGSTNGSWINGEKLPTRRLVLIRDSDFLQFADVVFKAHYQASIDIIAQNAGFRLFVVRRDQEVAELDPSKFEGTIVTEFGISFELRSDGFFLEFDSPEISVQLNGDKVSQSRQLHSNDLIQISDVELIVVEGQLSVNRMSSTRKTTEVSVPEKVRVDIDLTGIDHRSEKLDSKEVTPGNISPTAHVHSPTQTVMIDPSKLGRARFGEALAHDASSADDVGTDSSYRFGHEFSEPKTSWFDFENFNDSEKRVLIGIIFFAIASLLLLIVWFFLLR